MDVNEELSFWENSQKIRGGRGGSLVEGVRLGVGLVGRGSGWM